MTLFADLVDGRPLGGTLLLLGRVPALNHLRVHSEEEGQDLFTASVVLFSRTGGRGYLGSNRRVLLVFEKDLQRPQNRG